MLPTVGRSGRGSLSSSGQVIACTLILWTGAHVEDAFAADGGVRMFETVMSLEAKPSSDRKEKIQAAVAGHEIDTIAAGLEILASRSSGEICNLVNPRLVFLQLAKMYPGEALDAVRLKYSMWDEMPESVAEPLATLIGSWTPENHLLVSFCIDGALTDKRGEGETTYAEGFVTVPLRICDLGFSRSEEKLCGAISEGSEDARLRNAWYSIGYDTRDDVIGRFSKWWRDNKAYLRWSPTREQFVVDTDAKSCGIAHEAWVKRSEEERSRLLEEAKRAGRYIEPGPCGGEITPLSPRECVEAMSELLERSPDAAGLKEQVAEIMKGKEREVMWELQSMMKSKWTKPCEDAGTEKLFLRMMEWYPREMGGGITGMFSHLNLGAIARLYYMAAFEGDSRLVFSSLVEWTREDTRLAVYGCGEPRRYEGEPDRICDWALMLASMNLKEVREEIGSPEELAKLETTKERDERLVGFNRWYLENRDYIKWSDEKSGFIVQR